MRERVRVQCLMVYAVIHSCVLWADDRRMNRLILDMSFHYITQNMSRTHSSATTVDEQRCSNHSQSSLLMYLISDTYSSSSPVKLNLESQFTVAIDFASFTRSNGRKISITLVDIIETRVKNANDFFLFLLPSWNVSSAARWIRAHRSMKRNVSHIHMSSPCSNVQEQYTDWPRKRRKFDSWKCVAALFPPLL